MDELRCEELRALSGELACGTVTAEEQEQAVLHLRHCARCRDEVREMGEVADGLASLAPLVQPPAGFESRVLDALGFPSPGTAADQSPPCSSAGRRDGRAWAHLVLRVAAVVLLASAVGLGGWVAGHVGRSDRVPTAASGGSDHLVASVLRANGQPVGQVVISAVPDWWLSMAVDADLGPATLRCEVVDHGHVVVLGSFSVAAGYGYWATAVPVDPSGITVARLVDPEGHVVAYATLNGSDG